MAKYKAAVTKHDDEYRVKMDSVLWKDSSALNPSILKDYYNGSCCVWFSGVSGAYINLIGLFPR